MRLESRDILVGTVSICKIEIKFSCLTGLNSIGLRSCQGDCRVHPRNVETVD